MTALSPGDSWFVIGALAFTAAVVCLAATVVCLAATVVYLVLTWRQDREEWTRPECRRWVSVEDSSAEARREESKVGLVFTVVAILVVVVLAALGV